MSDVKKLSDSIRERGRTFARWEAEGFPGLDKVIDAYEKSGVWELLVGADDAEGGDA